MKFFNEFACTGVFYAVNLLREQVTVIKVKKIMAAICHGVDATCRLWLAVKYVCSLSKLAMLGTFFF